MKDWLTKLLFDWVFVLLYRLFQGFLNLVDFIESFFDIFAGTAKVIYKGTPDFLINIFFGHDAVTNAFWAMALIAIVLAFGFCVLQMARKATDVTGSVKQTVGQIFSNFIRCLLIILLLNAGTVAAINITNVLLDRINYALENAAILDQEEKDKTFSEQEYATMTKILATVANYSVNPSADSRYNVNSCFNAIRMDLLSLHVNGFFRYDYPMDQNGHYTWQGALALLASSADLTTDLDLDVYYSDVTAAFQKVSKEISTYKGFAPVQTAQATAKETMDTDVLIFLIAGMQASQNAMYDTGDFNDAIRRGYVTGDKSYNNMKQVRKDFDIWEMDYLVGYVTCIVFVIIMAICIFTFIVRMFNLLLLYISAPLFASSMPLDDGGKWQSWTQAFVIQLFSGFGMVIAMRLYLIIIPIVISSDLVFFAGSGLDIAILNRMAQLLMVLGGAWAVLQAGSVITGILAGNPGMAAIQQEGRIGGMVMGWAMRAPRAALGATGSLIKAPTEGIQKAKGMHQQSQNRHLERGTRKEQLASRDAFKRQMAAESLQAKADSAAASGSPSAARLQRKADAAQKSAATAQSKLDQTRAKYGIRPGVGEESGGSPGGAGAPASLGVGGAGRTASVGAAGSAGGAGTVSGAGSGGAAMQPPPPRFRNPYTPEMYEVPPMGGGASASGGASVSGGGSPFSGGRASASGGGSVSGGGSSAGGAVTAPRASAAARAAAGPSGAATRTPGAPAGKSWTPPSLSPDSGGGAPMGAPRSVPFAQQFVDAAVPADQPRARAASAVSGGVRSDAAASAGSGPASFSGVSGVSGPASFSGVSGGRMGTPPPPGGGSVGAPRASAAVRSGGSQPGVASSAGISGGRTAAPPPSGGGTVGAPRSSAAARSGGSQPGVAPAPPSSGGGTVSAPRASSAARSGGSQPGVAPTPPSSGSGTGTPPPSGGGGTTPPSSPPPPPPPPGPPSPPPKRRRGDS